MAGRARHADPGVISLIAVFEAAWSVVGRYAYALDLGRASCSYTLSYVKRPTARTAA